MKQHQTHVVVRDLPEGVKDIFWGIGWDNWTRVRLVLQPKPEFVHVAGIKMPFYVRIATMRYLRLDKTA